MTSSNKTVAIIVGTRPEVIKCAPLVAALGQRTDLRPLVLSTGQHREMAAQAFAAFGLEPEIDLDLMRSDQTPNSFLAELLAELEKVLPDLHPAGVLVQGDTTTALGAALAAFHLRLPLAHLEAGLRTHRLDAPFPEEMNRSVISRIASLHFCPTEIGRENLRREGISENVFVVGNTVVDAALSMTERLQRGEVIPEPQVAALAASGRPLLLVTGHRRESFDGPLEALCGVLARLRDALPELEIVYPVHLNPKVRSTVFRALGDQQRIHLLEPIDYPSLLTLIRHARLIVTDSGGIQEEAPSFGRKVLVTRISTERPEAITSGDAELAPLSEPDVLYRKALAHLTADIPAQTRRRNPFGDGASAARIAALLARHWA